MKPKKRTFLSLVFAAFATLLSGQTVYSYHGGIVPGVANVGSSVYYLEKSFDGCCMYWNYLIRAKNGQVVSRINLSSSFSFSHSLLIDATADQHLAVVAGTISGGACDVVPSPRPVIFKYDTTGSLLWKIAVKNPRFRISWA